MILHHAINHVKTRDRGVSWLKPNATCHIGLEPNSNCEQRLLLRSRHALQCYNARADDMLRMLHFQGMLG